MRAIVRALSALAFSGLAALAALAAAADGIARQDSLETLTQAVTFETGPWLNWAGPNAEHLDRLAELEALASDKPGAAVPMLERAVAANPRSSAAWLRLGLERERAQNYGDAEAALLQAASVDHQYLPAWTVANFYFRRGNQSAFWPWAARAAAVTYDDFRPLLHLADQLEPDPLQVLSRLKSGDRPGDPRMARAYLDLTISSQRWTAAEQIAFKLIEAQNHDDSERIADLVSREIRANRAAPALSLWDAVFVPLNPEIGPVLTNGNLAEEPSGSGFDWRLRACPGVETGWLPEQLTFTFSGHQPDQCDLLEQPIPVAHGRRYRLKAFRSVHLPGVSFEMGDGSIEEEPYESAQTGLALLKLVYRRAPGGLPAKGNLSIGNIRLEVQ